MTYTMEPRLSGAKFGLQTIEYILENAPCLLKVFGILFVPTPLVQRIPQLICLF